jgi:hypothetical protein
MHFIFKQLYQKRAKNYFVLKICENTPQKQAFSSPANFDFGDKSIKLLFFF